ncbi:hypothetical protein [Pseudoalteromonas denitrificans]|uniref:Uncharacterized protein n=1 Tax=Pseudoalteromonas denitrificans DSM 6059 TaxID=1123010 RepID=A0A1I1FKX7_9GAMM|nr:hypothetical protein [Pseudoalteromonas denitrificans]SFB99974.1 hypothetical protein SAMN02745724_00678 [Pseudoalteromonas denitrificans DSM 6059]
MGQNIKLTITFILFWLVFQITYAIGMFVNQNRNINTFINSIETRIALDLPRLSLPDQVFNSVGDQSAVLTYIAQFNAQLETQNSPVKVLAIKGFKIGSLKQNFTRINKALLAPGQTIEIELAVNNLAILQYLHIAPLLFAFAFLYLCLSHINHWRDDNADLLFDEEQDKTPILIIDLKSKVIINSQTQVSIPLANKPLCFFIALTEFCILDKETVLNQNKDLPLELTDLANKYFLRLIELGHTIRKRPNFTNSLEKTLSEIRAALDEVFIDYPEVKAIYYPPKASGEGSRSKLHHYGLAMIESQHIELIGK